VGCCGTRYYCTANGPVAVEPDDNGRYDIPEGGTSGWYKTQAEAYVQCPAPPVALADCYPEAGYVVPGLITLSVVNVVNATSFMQRWPYSEASTVHPAGGGPFGRQRRGCRLSQR